MIRLLQTIGVKKECFSEYCDLHDNIWPDVAQAIQDANLHNYSIFHLDGKLYQYMEYVGEQMEQDLARLSESDAMRRWCEICKTMQIPDSGQWETATEVFHQN